jgi:hypothetical protein
MAIERNVIKRLKREHGKIFATKYQGKEYVFRALNVGELDLVTFKASAEHEDRVVEDILLYPEDINIDTMPAGFVAAILNEASRVSGFDTPAEANAIIDQKRDNMNMVIPAIKAFIKAGQPDMTKEDMNKLSFDELLDELVFSEKVLEIISNVTNPTVEAITFTMEDPVAKAEEEATRDPVKERLLEAMKSLG